MFYLLLLLLRVFTSVQRVPYVCVQQWKLVARFVPVEMCTFCTLETARVIDTLANEQKKSTVWKAQESWPETPVSLGIGTAQSD